ncbi:glycosyl transferase [Bacterioplanes sanyensis]|uniref:glycosyltransferase family 2 protein n=1 Tax=Bacterioplanes sanyensis TaxID=1249553 RepID=UPI00167BA339|nr:glycosyltransferase family 2 protein [Bacterioplanes sanyensis]GGY35827.1 glycosyl transferase [Bacterioplanes sanyensis]
MKLIIQIPCYNEEQTLEIALSQLPREVEGFDTVEWLIIDDGCTDNTVEVARRCGVDHIVSLSPNQGLAKGFIAGLQRGLQEGADVIVNTDADNQYCADDIPALVQPVLKGEADYVVGERPIASIEHFSPVKKALQRLGSWVVRLASRSSVPDAPSGFRAMSRECAMQLSVFSEYTYTLETVIQAGQKGMAITSVPVRVNEDLRPSKLVSSIPSYVRKSMMTIVRMFVVYQPFRFFLTVGGVLFGLGFLLGLRFLWFYLGGDGDGHIQSLILASVLMGMGFQTALVAFVADLLSVNRKLLEELRYRSRKSELDASDSSHAE